MSKTHFLGGIVSFIIVITVAFAVRDHIGVTAEAPTGKLRVAASFYPLYFFASEIAGDKAVVANITPAGAEPHDYEPTAQDMAWIEGSDILILNGGGFEPWGDGLQKSLDAKRTIIVTAGESVIATDPHVWLDPALAEKMADAIAAAFKAADPANGEYYDSNLEMLTSKLAALDAEYSQGLSSCAQKSIITSHAAFGYMAAAYHFDQMPIAGLSPDAEPSPKQLADIAVFAKSNGIGYIFFESLASPKLSETIAREVGAETLVLNPLEGLSQKELAQGKDYFTEMRNNLSHLEIALQCKK